METWDPKPERRREFRGPVRRDRDERPRESSSASCCPSRRRSWTGSPSCAPSTTAPATTPRATTGCSPASRARPSTPPDFTVQRRPSMGSAVGRGCAAPNGAGHAALRRRAAPARRHRQPLPLRAYLGGAANPFVVESDPNDAKLPGPEPVARRTGLTLDRLEDRRRVLERLDQLRARRRPRASATSTPHYQRAFDMLTSQQVARGLRHQRRAREAARPLRPAHLRPERPAGAAAGRGGRHLRDGQLRPVGPPRHRRRSSKTEEGAQAAHPAARPGHRRAGRRPDRPRPVRVDAGRGDGRVRPHAADEQGRRPRPLGQHLQRADGLRLDADGPGDRHAAARAASTSSTGRSARRTSPRRSTTTSASTPARSRSRTAPAGRPT